MRKILLFFAIFSSLATADSVEQTITLDNFSAGELSPLVQAQVKLPQYSRGAKTLENMLVRTQGPITRRPGTKYIASVKNAAHNTRLIPFEFPPDLAYMLESGDEYARFYRLGAQILDGSTPYEITTPWDESDVFEVQWAQNAKTMRLVHGDYEPYKLTRTGHAAWTCEPINSTTGPFLKENTETSFTITPSRTGDEAGYDYYVYDEDSQASIYGAQWMAQTFQASASYTAIGASIRVWRVGWPGTVTVSLKDTTGGKPTGADLAVGTLDGDTLWSDVIVTGEWREITFSAGTALTSGTTYALVVRATSGDASNLIKWRHDASSPTYTNGSYAISGDSGSNWTLNTSSDFVFEIIADTMNSNITTLEASADLFDAGHVGGLFQITHYLGGDGVSHRFYLNGADNSSTITVQKYRYFDVLTAGNWKGRFIIQKSYDDGGTWQEVQGWTYSYTGNIQYTGQELEGRALYRMRMEDMVRTGHQMRHGEAMCDANLNVHGFMNNGVVEITTVTDANTAIGEIKTALGSTDTTWRWAEGAWSDYRGWPRTIEYHEGRVVYGGSVSWPQTIWASIIAENDADFDDFTANTESDSEGNLGGPDDIAWIYDLPGLNLIQWMKSGDYLMVGTTGGVGKLGQPDKPITPNFPPTYRIQNYNGCAYLQPAEAVDALLYVERGEEKVRELVYTFSTERYEAPDMTILAEHITGDGIVETSFQHRPEPVLWCVREDGELLSFTYHRAGGTMAWGRNDTGATGLFKSVASIPGSTDEDELWQVVGRTVNSTAVKYIELAQPWDWGTDQNDCYFVDSGTTSLTSLTHLEGETVALWADGRSIGTYTVAGGLISPSGSYTNTIIGLPYTSVFETMPLAVRQRNGQYVNALETNIHYVLVDFYETFGCSVGVDSANVEDYEFGMSTTTTVDLVTDYRDGPIFEGTNRAPTLYFTESDPGPMTIRSINSLVEVEY